MSFCSVAQEKIVTKSKFHMKVPIFCSREPIIATIVGNNNTQQYWFFLDVEER
jgi:hypothetical protein